MQNIDQMTSNERMEAYFKGEEVDRLPAMPMIGTMAPRFIGEQTRFKRLSPENNAYVQEKTYELLGLDGLDVEYGLHGIGQAFGTELSDPENTAPHIVRHRLTSLEQMRELDLELVRRVNNPLLDYCCRSCEILQDHVGDIVGSSVSLSGPMTAATSLYPTDKFLVARRKQPELAHELLRLCTDALIIVTEEIAKMGIDVFLCDPVASGDIISLKEYREWVLPYTQEIVESTHKHGVAVGYHICGDTNKLTEAMLETGVDMLSVDAKVPLTRAKEIAGPIMPVIGNVDPIDTMMLGTAEDVRAEIGRNIADCEDSPCGYIIGTGCDLPANTPLEQVYTFMDAVREYGPVRLGQKK